MRMHVACTYQHVNCDFLVTSVYACAVADRVPEILYTVYISLHEILYTVYISLHALKKKACGMTYVTRETLDRACLHLTCPINSSFFHPNTLVAFSLAYTNEPAGSEACSDRMSGCRMCVGANVRRCQCACALVHVRLCAMSSIRYVHL